MNEAWVVKYKPQTLEEIILPKSVIEQWQEHKDVDANVLFSGPAGTGKTSLARIICQGFNTKYIDCSTETGIDVVRNTIMNFGTTASLKSGKKKIILDEVDGFTPSAQKSLKATMEAIESTTNFVLTTNHPERLIAPLHSRLEHTKFAFTDEEKKDQQIKFLNRIKAILKLEGYTIANDAITYLLTNIFPDIRKVLIMLYQVSRNLPKGSTITLSTINDTVLSVDKDLYAMLVTPKTEPEIYKFVKSNYDGKFKNAFDALGDNFLQWLIQENKSPELILTIAAIVHKYQFESSMTSYNPMLGLLACCNTINSFFRS